MSYERHSRWILLPLPVLAASLLCSLASGSQAIREYKDSDKDLNAVYQKVLAIITDPQDRRLFIEAQRSWIKFRDDNVAFHARHFPESKGGLFVATDMTQERAKELARFLADSATRGHEAPFAGKSTK